MSQTKHVPGVILAVLTIVLTLTTGCASLRGRVDKNYLDVETIRIKKGADDAKPAATLATPVETWEWTPKKGDTLSGLYKGSGYDRLFGDFKKFAKAINKVKDPDEILAGVSYTLPAAPPNGKLVVAQPTRREAPSMISLVPTVSKPTSIKLPVIATSVSNGSEEKARIADQNIQINQLEATNTRLQDELAAEKLTRISEQARLAKAQVDLASRQDEVILMIKKNDDLQKENATLRNPPRISWPAVLVAFGIGAVVATLLGIVAWRTRRKNTSSEQQVERLQREVEQKRTENLELRMRIGQLEMDADAATKQHFYPLSLRGTGLINRRDPKSRVINVWLDPVLSKQGVPMTCCGIDRNTAIRAKEILNHAHRCTNECRLVHNVDLEHVPEPQPQQATA